MSLKTIIHLYPSVYNNTITKPGIGDFIRGSIFLAQYALQNKMKIIINIANHPIYKYTLEEADKVYTEIPNEFNEGWSSEKIMIFLNKFKNSNRTEVFINCNMFYEKSKVTKHIKNYINSIFKFKDIYYDMAKNIATEPYEIFHLRTLDNEVENPLFSFHLNKKINEQLDINKRNIVLSNNFILKEEVASRFKLLNVNTKPCHTANTLNYRLLEDTVIDFILISRASKIHTFSFYSHGSGFSEQCALLNDIPFTTCFIVSPNYFKPTNLSSLEEWQLMVELYNYIYDILKTIFGLESKKYKLDITNLPTLREWETILSSIKKNENFLKDNLGYGLL